MQLSYYYAYKFITLKHVAHKGYLAVAVEFIDGIRDSYGDALIVPMSVTFSK